MYRLDSNIALSLYVLEGVIKWGFDNFNLGLLLYVLEGVIKWVNSDFESHL